MKILVTGGAGFIGSHLVRRLVEAKHSVTVVDDLSLGREKHLAPFMECNDFRFVKADIRDQSLMTSLCDGIQVVFHMAANSDIAASSDDNSRDFQVGTVGTFSLLNACRTNRVSRFVFASTSAIYGEPSVSPTPEDYGPLFPISHYGASKLAAEGMISAFCANYGMKSWIFRFANIVGPNATHGVIFDFLNRLRENTGELRILGDGTQKKSYLHVHDCVDAILYCFEHTESDVNVFNLAHPGAVTVSEIADICIGVMGLKNVRHAYTGGDRGWIGDVPVMELDPSRVNGVGWKASMTPREAVEKAAGQIAKQVSQERL